MSSLQNDILCLLTKGVQENIFGLERRVVRPFCVKIPRPGEQKVKFREMGDTIKIKGFILEGYVESEYSNDYIEIAWSQECYLKIPMSFLLAYKITVLSDNKIFIELPHNYLLDNAEIPLIALPFYEFEINIHSNSKYRNYEIYAVIDRSVYDVNERKELTQGKTHYIRQIQPFTLSKNISLNDSNKFSEMLTSVGLLCQGIFVKNNKNNIKSIIVNAIQKSNKEDKPNTNIEILNYDRNLLTIYGEQISDELTYFSFNSLERFGSENMVGSFNFSRVEMCEVKIELINTENNNRCEVFFVNWNHMKYTGGLCGITFGF